MLHSNPGNITAPFSFSGLEDSEGGHVWTGDSGCSDNAADSGLQVNSWEGNGATPPFCSNNTSQCTDFWNPSQNSAAYRCGVVDAKSGS